MVVKGIGSGMRAAWVSMLALPLGWMCNHGQVNIPESPFSHLIS